MAFPIIQTREKIKQRFFQDLGDDQSIEMVFIEGDTFLMGSPAEEKGRYDNEGPQREVTVSSFMMGRYPVTQAQWQRVSQFDRVNQDLEENPSYFKDKDDSPQRPVEQVSWHDAQEFCARLSAHTRRNYRLPSEAEWEYACRAGTTTPFGFGEILTLDVANYFDSQQQETTPVGYFPFANAFGLCDMHGNVWEWCLDHWHNTYDDAPIDGSAWINKDGESDRRVTRGGSWGYSPRYCRSACRVVFNPRDRGTYLGFRVILAPP